MFIHSFCFQRYTRCVWSKVRCQSCHHTKRCQRAEKIHFYNQALLVLSAFHRAAPRKFPKMWKPGLCQNPIVNCPDPKHIRMYFKTNECAQHVSGPVRWNVIAGWGEQGSFIGSSNVLFCFDVAKVRASSALCLRFSAACEKCLLRTHSPPSRAATAVNVSSCWWPPLALGAHTSLYMRTDEKERRAGSLVKNSLGSHAARRQDRRR